MIWLRNKIKINTEDSCFEKDTGDMQKEMDRRTGMGEPITPTDIHKTHKETVTHIQTRDYITADLAL